MLNPCGEGRRSIDRGCEPVVARGACEPGTMARLGSRRCQEVGPQCPEGFERAPSGWGCATNLTESACTGATREVAGGGRCALVGDCLSAFPPSEADYFVDDDYGPDDLDSTHFDSLYDALLAVPGNATIAVMPGIYYESVYVDRPVRIVGRCAGEVWISVNGAPRPGLTVNGARGVVVSGVTFALNTIGVIVAGGGEVGLESVVLEQNFGVGVVATGAGSVLSMQGSTIRDTLPSDELEGWGATADAGGRVEVSDSFIDRNQRAGVAVIGTGSEASLTRTLVRRTFRGAGAEGIGLGVQDGGTLSMERSVVAQNAGLGSLVAGVGSVLTLRQSVLAGTRTGPDGRGGIGIHVQQGARALLDGVTLTDNGEVGLLLTDSGGGGGGSRATVTGSVIQRTRPNTVIDEPPGYPPFARGFSAAAQDGSRLEVSGSALVDQHEVGVLVSGAGTTAALRDSLITGVRENERGQFGAGVAVVSGASASLERVTVEDTDRNGVQLSGEGTIAELAWCYVRDVLAPAGGLESARGVEVSGGATAVVDRSRIEAVEGIAFAASAASAIVEGSSLRENAVGVHVQDGSSLREVSEPPPEPSRLEVLVTEDTLFLDNGTRVGSGSIPLTSPLSEL